MWYPALRIVVVRASVGLDEPRGGRTLVGNTVNDSGQRRKPAFPVQMRRNGVLRTVVRPGHVAVVLIPLVRAERVADGSDG